MIVVARPKNEDLMTLNKVPAVLMDLIGVTRKRATIYQWVVKGRADTHGQIVKLKAYNRLGRYYTTEACLIEFLKAIGD